MTASRHNGPYINPGHVANLSFLLSLSVESLHGIQSWCGLTFLCDSMDHPSDSCVWSALDEDLGDSGAGCSSKLGQGPEVSYSSLITEPAYLPAQMAQVGVSQLQEELVSYQKSIQGQMSAIVNCVASSQSTVILAISEASAKPSASFSPSRLGCACNSQACGASCWHSKGRAAIFESSDLAAFGFI